MTLSLTDVVIEMIDKNPAAYEEMLLGALVEDQDLFRKMKDSLCVDAKGNATQDFQNPLYNGLYAVLKLFYTYVYEKPGDRLEKPVISNLIPSVASMDANLALQSTDDVACWELLEYLRSKEYGGAAALAQAGFEHWLGKRRTAGAISNVTQLPGWKVSDLTGSLTNALGNVTLKKPDTQFAFSSGLDDEDEEEVFRLKLNISNLDAALGGGIGLGEAMMVLAAPAGGKTIFATQAASNMAANISLAAEANGGYPEGSNLPAKGLLVTTEQEHKELVPRFITQVSSEIPFDLIKDGVKQAKLDEKQIECVRNAESRLNGRLWIENWQSQRDTATFKEDLRILIEEFIENHEYMDFLVFDWVGGALSERIDHDLDKLRVLYLRAAEALCEVAKEYNIAVIYMVQGKKDLCLRAGTRVDQTCCQECKTMDNKATWSIGISIVMTKLTDEDDPEKTPTFEEEQSLFICKGRKSKGGTVKVFRHFEYQKFGNTRMSDVLRSRAEKAAKVAEARQKGVRS